VEVLDRQQIIGLRVVDQSEILKGKVVLKGGNEETIREQKGGNM
jgi:hypothetical protein